MKRFAALTLVLSLCMTLFLCACGDASTTQNDTTSTTTTTQATTTTTVPPVETAAFEVTVVDQNGTPVAGVMMQLCKDTCIPKVTDANGVAAFDAEITDGYKLSVLSCPTGYSYTGEAEIYLESGITEYTVQVQGEA